MPLLQISEDEMDEIRAFYELLLTGDDDEKPELAVSIKIPGGKSLSSSNLVTNRRMTSTDIQSLFNRIGVTVTSDQIREIIKGAHESYYRKSDNSLPNDSINFNEFVHLINDKPPANVSREQLVTAFKILSENEEGETEGYLSVDELGRYLTHFHYCTEKHFEEEQEMNDEDAEYLESSNPNLSLNLKQAKKTKNFLTDPQYDMRPFTKKDFHKLVDILDPYCSGHINYLKYVSMMYDGLIQGEDLNNNTTTTNANNNNKTMNHHK